MSLCVKKNIGHSFQLNNSHSSTILSYSERPNWFTFYLILLSEHCILAYNAAAQIHPHIFFAPITPALFLSTSLFLFYVYNINDKTVYNFSILILSFIFYISILLHNNPMLCHCQEVKDMSKNEDLERFVVKIQGVRHHFSYFTQNAHI